MQLVEIPTIICSKYSATCNLQNDKDKTIKITGVSIIKFQFLCLLCTKSQSRSLRKLKDDLKT